MNWSPHPTAARLRHLTDCRRYSVSAMHPTDGHEPWWEARDSTGREIAAGYGDSGLAKCKSFCEIDALREQVPTSQAKTIGVPTTC